MATKCLDCTDITSTLRAFDYDLNLPNEDKLKLNLDVKDLTEGSVVAITRDNRQLLEWRGEKILDKLLEVMSENLRTQYDSGRLQGKEYADVYAQSIVSVIAQSVQFATTKANLEIQLKSQWEIELAKIKLQLKQLEFQIMTQIAELKIKCCKAQAEIRQTNSQARVLDRQLMGFDDNMYIKLLEYQMNAFSLIYSSGMLDDASLPAPLNVNEMGNLYKLYKDRIAETLPVLLQKESANPQDTLYLS